VAFAIKEHDKAERWVRIFAVRHAAKPHADEFLAARELARYLEMMTGTRLSVGEETTPRAGVFRVARLAIENRDVRADELSPLGWDGCCVSVGQDAIALTGARPRGTLLGVYRFLEDLGCGFFAPDCERVPKAGHVALTYSRKQHRPFFSLRAIGTVKQGGGSVYEFLGNPLAILADEEKKLYPRLWIDHTAGFLVPPWKYFETHPEFFSHTPDGKVTFDIGTATSALNPFGEDLVRKRTDMVWLCMSHPEVRRIAAGTLLQWISRQPEHPFFSIHQGDSSFPCRCDGCARVGTVTDNLVAFANALAGPVREKFPGRTLLVFAYGNVMDVLPKIQPADNVCVLFAPIDAASSVHCCLSPEYNAVSRRQFLRWQSVAADRMGVYEYNLDPRAPCLDKMISAIQEYARFNLRGVFYCGAASLMPELFSYVNSKLLWDPRQSPAALIHGFCDACYGPAAPEMEEFVGLKRRQVNAPGVRFGSFYGAKPDRAFYSPRFSEAASRLLARAEEAVLGDKLRLGRVRKVRRAVLSGILESSDWTDPACCAADRKSYAGYLSQYLKLLGEPGEKSAKVSEFLRNTVHWQVSESWQRDPLVVRFLADPAGTLEKELPAVRASFQKEVPGGWQLTLEAFRGGTGPVYYRWMCPGKIMKGIYGRGSNLESMRAMLVLRQAPPGETALVLEGQTHDREGNPARIRIRLNDAILSEGPNRFVSRGWSTQSFPVPPGTLRHGENLLEIENLEQEAKSWFLVSDAKIVLPAR